MCLGRRQFNLDLAVGCVRECHTRRDWQGATKLRANARKEEQRGQARTGHHSFALTHVLFALKVSRMQADAFGQYGYAGGVAPRHSRLPTLNSVSKPSAAKMAAAIACTSVIDIFFAIVSPRKTAGTFASIMPNVVPVTTEIRSV